MNRPDHSLCRWVARLHDGMVDSSEPPVRLRASAERLLLERHAPDAARSCRYDGEEFPCLEWRAIAAGWAHVPGFDPAWVPPQVPPEPGLAVIDVLIAELTR